MDSTYFTRSSVVSWAGRILTFFKRKSNTPASTNGLLDFNA